MEDHYMDPPDPHHRRLDDDHAIKPKPPWYAPKGALLAMTFSTPMKALVPTGEATNKGGMTGTEFLAICRWSANVFASRLLRVAAGDTSLPFKCHACTYLFRPSRLPTPFQSAERFLPQAAWQSQDLGYGLLRRATARVWWAANFRAADPDDCSLAPWRSKLTDVTTTAAVHIHVPQPQPSGGDFLSARELVELASFDGRQAFAHRNQRGTAAGDMAAVALSCQGHPVGCV
eukprot:Skav232028  [mRNA]  locus=scaffold541:136188:147241:+ [translate_table: standard]